MKFSGRKYGTTLVAALATLILFFSGFANAESETKSLPDVQQFEIIDGTGQVAGEPDGTSATARVKWSKACDDWKTETKGLNKKNEVLAMNCGAADCAYQENGSYVCTSTATYKLKIAGRLAPPLPTPVESKTETIVQTPPPQVVYEVTPAPQPGFVWVNGFWGWQGMRHVWYPGHWVNERPGQIWIGHQWIHRGAGWHFESGHWGHR